VSIPMLRKDFIIDPYQVKEAKAFGADAVLLIATITEGEQLSELLHACREFKVQALVDCYSQNDLKNVIFDQVEVLGANNRDLHTFEVDLHRGVELLHQAPEETVLVSESGLHAPEDLQYLYEQHIDAALIGEYFMRQPDPGEAVRQMRIKTQELIANQNKSMMKRTAEQTKLKVCGLTSLEDARFVSGALAHYLGFIFYEDSPRHITPAKA